jgi:hypothetical protein
MLACRHGGGSLSTAKWAHVTRRSNTHQTTRNSQFRSGSAPTTRTCLRSVLGRSEIALSGASRRIKGNALRNPSATTQTEFRSLAELLPAVERCQGRSRHNVEIAARAGHSARCDCVEEVACQEATCPAQRFPALPGSVGAPGPRSIPKAMFAPTLAEAMLPPRSPRLEPQRLCERIRSAFRSAAGKS